MKNAPAAKALHGPSPPQHQEAIGDRLEEALVQEAQPCEGPNAVRQLLRAACRARSIVGPFSGWNPLKKHHGK